MTLLAPVGCQSPEYTHLVTMPARRQWARLTFSVTNHSQRDKVRVVEDGTKSMRDRVSKLSTLMYTAWCFWSCMRPDASGEGEL